MSCLSPLKGFITYPQNEIYNSINDSVKLGEKAISVPSYDKKKVRYRNNRKIVVKSRKVDHLELIAGKLVSCYDDNISQFAEKVYKDFIYIPCGQCKGCRLQYSREWANRMLLECMYHDFNYFITLTYNDDNVPFSYTLDEYGNYRTSLTLKKKDVQDFMKRLRKNYKYDNHLKYYCAGEYGSWSNTHRPHYHLIMFGLKLDDLKFYSRSELGFNYYTSEFLDSIWNKGRVLIGEVTWETCAYTARYCMKKLNGNASWIYDDLNIEPEFVTMSLKPAIGYEYFQDHKDEIYDLDNIYVKTMNGGKQFKPPRYFDEKMCYNVEDFAKLSDLKTVRQSVSDSNLKHKLENCDYDFEEYLEVERELLETRLKALPRKDL